MQFLINTITHWEEPPRARHQVTFALSKKHQVVFIEANKPGLPGMKSVKIHGNLEVVTPYYPIVNKIRWRLRFINERYQNWLFKKLVRRYGDFRVINFDFTATKLYDFFDNVIFYYNDNFASISARQNPSFVAKYHHRCESEVARKAAFCITISDILSDKLREFNASVYTIPLGSPDIDEYNIDIQNRISSGPKIKAGLVGFISLRNTSTRVLNLLLQDENIDLTIIGPVEESLQRQLENRERLRLAGTLTGKALYEEINTFDVAIAPYCRDLVSDPDRGQGTGNKLYQYLAMGKPVVITNLQGLKELILPSGFIYIVHEEDDFPMMMQKAIEENSEYLIETRIKYSKKNSWTERMKILVDHINHAEMTKDGRLPV